MILLVFSRKRIVYEGMGWISRVMLATPMMFQDRIKYLGIRLVLSCEDEV